MSTCRRDGEQAAPDQHDKPSIPFRTAGTGTVSIRGHYCLRTVVACLVALLSLSNNQKPPTPLSPSSGLVTLASGHVVLTKDEHSHSLVLTGEDGKGGKGGGDQLVIAGHNMGDSDNSNMVMQDAANREGDVVIQGNSMIIPGEDGHIVLSDSRRRGGGSGFGFQHPMLSPLMYWTPYMNNRFAARMMPFFGGPFG